MLAYHIGWFLLNSKFTMPPGDIKKKLEIHVRHFLNMHNFKQL